MPRKPKVENGGTGVPPNTAPAASSKSADKPQTGTARVIGAGGITIPGPTLPRRDDPPEKKKSAASSKSAEPEPAPYVLIGSAHLIKSLARNNAQSREIRLRNLARTNRDVAWLLDEHQKLSKPKK